MLKGDYVKKQPTQSAIVKNGHWITFEQKQELAESVEADVRLREQAYQEVVVKLNLIIQFFHLWPLIQSGAGSKDEELAAEKTAEAKEYLIKLRGQFADACAVYHARLIKIPDHPHGLIRMPDTSFINDFLELQAIVQDSIIHALNHPEAIKAIHDDLMKSPLLDHDFASLVARSKRRKRDRATETIETGRRVQQLMNGRGKNSGMSRTLAISTVADEINSSFSAVAQAYTRWLETQENLNVRDS